MRERLTRDHLQLPLNSEHSICSVVNNQSSLAEPNRTPQGTGEAVKITICMYSLSLSTYIHTYTYTYRVCSLGICIYIYSYGVCVCVYVCMCIYTCVYIYIYRERETAAAAKSLQSCPTLCDPIDSSPPGSPIPGILQARTLEWVAISSSNA